MRTLWASIGLISIVIASHVTPPGSLPHSPVVKPGVNGRHFTGTYVPIVAIPDNEISTITTSFPGGPAVQGNVAMNPPPSPAPTMAVELIANNATSPLDTEKSFASATDPAKVLQNDPDYPNPVQAQVGPGLRPYNPATYSVRFPMTVEFGWHVDTTNVTIGTYILVIAVAGTDAQNNPVVSVMAHRVSVEH